MPERGDTEAFSNPLAPAVSTIEDDDDALPLTNDDFRKLLMTPRVGKQSSSSGASSSATPAAQAKAASSGSSTHHSKKPIDDTIKEEDDPALKRKKKKIYYAKLKKLEDERQKELAEKYRDRARERRDGANTDYEQTDIISTTADYRAVAPDAQAGENYQERRKQIIQESKYLGGDMEHTHLVKGLDYALLEKVRAEIVHKEEENDEEMEELVIKTEKKKEQEKEDPEQQMQFKTRMGRSVYRAVFKRHVNERNELFIPGRMCYVVDLEDDYESDIPTTLIRSKADCPTLEATTALTTNDIVISKLTQILSYLRQGKKDRKLKKKEKALKMEERNRMGDENIYDGIDNYAPSFVKKDEPRDRKDRGDRDRSNRGDNRGDIRDNRDRRDRDRYERDDRMDRDRGRNDRDRDRDRQERDRRDRDRGGSNRMLPDRPGPQPAPRRSYFEKPMEEDDLGKELPKQQSASDMAMSINERFGKGWGNMGTAADSNIQQSSGQNQDSQMKKIKKKTTISSYAECYPGMMESADAIGDSDEEADYTKMDQGNKKGPVGRWDFDTQEEYSDYMGSKEALPKAAFQYGVKMADGRKTRRTGPKDEKKELDREWQKIQNIIAKRKHPGSGGGGGKQSRFNDDDD